MVTPDKWVWMPHPGHFICSDSCRFFMTTKVGSYIVSTIGEYWPDSQVRRIHAEVNDEVYKKDWYKKHKDLKGDAFDHAYMKHFGFEEIGVGRKYETMVFKAVKNTRDIKCCLFVQANGQNLDFAGYNSPEDAYKGHMKMCRKWAKK